MRFRLSRFLGRVFSSFPSGLLIGALIGAGVAVAAERQGLLIAGVILGVALEQLFLSAKRFVYGWRDTHPLRRLLGTIATDQHSYIFFSSFFRDLSRPAEFSLLRPGSSPEHPHQRVVGPVWLLGEGDATAISLMQGLLVRVGKRPDHIRLERAEKHMEEWGLSSICIGAHNPRTRVILAKSHNSPYVFDLNYKVITLREVDATAKTDTLPALKRGVYISQTPDSEPTDYGLVARISDPFHPSKKTTIVIAGLGPAGTAGAAYYLASNYRALGERNGDFSILVQVPSGYQSAREVEFSQVADFYASPTEVSS